MEKAQVLMDSLSNLARLINPCGLPSVDSGLFPTVRQKYFLLIYVDIDRTTSMTHAEEHIIIYEQALGYLRLRFGSLQDV